MVPGLLAKNAVLEIGTDALPASFIDAVPDGLSAAALKRLGAEGLTCASVSAYATARRVALLLEGIEDKKPRGATGKLLSRIFPELLDGMDLPGPVRGLLALCGRTVVPFAFAGAVSGDKALPAAGSKRPILIPEAGMYLKRLGERGILADPAKRRAAISSQLDRAAEKSGNWVDKDASLLEDALRRTESPACAVGRFSHETLRLPQALLTKVLKGEFKLFPMLSMAGKAQPGFAAVFDGGPEAAAAGRDALEKAVADRIDRVKALYDEDVRTRLRDKVTGELRARLERTVELAIWLCGGLWRRRVTVDLGAVEAIVRLAYSSLASAVVREFPELHGLMGGHYARRDGEWEKVASGVEEFGLPATPGGPLPSRLECCVASTAGKMEALAGMNDPAAARALAAGCIRIILEKRLPVPMREFIEKASSGVPAIDLPDLLWRCAETWFLEKGYAPDEIAAVRDNGLQDLTRTLRKLQALRSCRGNREFAALFAACRRAADLLERAGSPSAFVLDRNLIAEQAEEALYAAMTRAEKTVLDRASRDDFERGLKELQVLAPITHRFMSSVHILEEKEPVRKNRLALLARMLQLSRYIADLSRLAASSMEEKSA